MSVSVLVVVLVLVLVLVVVVVVVASQRTTHFVNRSSARPTHQRLLWHVRYFVPRYARSQRGGGERFEVCFRVSFAFACSRAGACVH